jgi:hypothetical protein
MQEVWKNIPTWEGYYQVSNKGNVKTLKRTTKDKLGRVRHRKERVLKQSTDRYGYKYVIFNLASRSRTYKVHRLVGLCFIGEPSLQINHKDLDKTNNMLDNLEYVTQSENMKHARMNKTYKSYYFKLSPDDKGQIRKLRRQGISYKEIASRYNVHPHTVYKVKL